jgi:hypothetical protein
VGRLISRSRSKSVVTLTIAEGDRGSGAHSSAGAAREAEARRGRSVSPTHVVFAPNKTPLGDSGVLPISAPRAAGGFGGIGDAARTRCRPVSRAEGSRGSLRMPHSRLRGTHVLRADAHQCKVSLEPTAAAVIIAGIPIARVATAIARASIMAIPSFGKLQQSHRELEKPFCRSNIYRTPASGVFHRKRFWFHDLWQQSGQRFAICGGNRTRSHPTMLRGDIAVRRRAGPTSGSVGLSTPLHLFRCSDSPAQHGQRGRERARQSRLPARG